MRIFVNKGFFIFVAVLIVLLAVIEHEEPGTVGQMVEEFHQITETEPASADPVKAAAEQDAKTLFYVVIGVVLFSFMFSVVGSSGRILNGPIVLAFVGLLLLAGIGGMLGVV